jgi:hypothetical protein
MPGPKVVTVIRGDDNPFGATVLEDGTGLDGGQVWGEWMLNGPSIDAMRISQPGTNQIEVVDAVIEDFKPRRGCQKWPQVPWRVCSGLHFDVVYVAQEASIG